MVRSCRSPYTLAALACIVIGVLWVGSYQTKATVRLPASAGSTRFELYSYRGQLAISTVADFPIDQQFKLVLRPSNAALAARWDTIFWADSWGGFSAESGHTWVHNSAEESVTRHWLNVIVPYWLMLPLALYAPARGACLALRAYRRVTHGQCASCGYAFDRSPACAECPACAARRQVIGLTPRTHLA